jgi:hypothetical protein
VNLNLKVKVQPGYGWVSFLYKVGRDRHGDGGRLMADAVDRPIAETTTKAALSRKDRPHMIFEKTS